MIIFLYHYTSVSHPSSHLIHTYVYCLGGYHAHASAGELGWSDPVHDNPRGYRPVLEPQVFLFNINICHDSNITDRPGLISEKRVELLDRRNTAGVEQRRRRSSRVVYATAQREKKTHSTRVFSTLHAIHDVKGESSDGVQYAADLAAVSLQLE